MRKTMRDMTLRQWKPLGAPYEPVGLTVLVMTEGCEIFRAYREKPCASKKDDLGYVRECDGEVVQDALCWDIV